MLAEFLCRSESNPVWVAVNRLYDMGGASMVALGAVSVLLLAVIFWKIVRFAVLGIWLRRRATRVVTLIAQGQNARAQTELARGRGLRVQLLRYCLASCANSSLSGAELREDIQIFGTQLIREARSA